MVMLVKGLITIYIYRMWKVVIIVLGVNVQFVMPPDITDGTTCEVVRPILEKWYEAKHPYYDALMVTSKCEFRKHLRNNNEHFNL